MHMFIHAHTYIYIYIYIFIHMMVFMNCSLLFLLLMTLDLAPAVRPWRSEAGVTSKQLAQCPTVKASTFFGLNHAGFP